MHDLNEVVRFNNATSTANGLNFRPDIWLLPFLNVYGIFAKSKPSTQVGYGIWIPDTTGNWHEAVSLEFQSRFRGNIFWFWYNTYHRYCRRLDRP